MMKTVFFNLDSTLFDHQHSRGCGFADLKTMHHVLSPEDIRDAPAWASPLSQRKSPRTVQRCDTAYFRRCELLERLWEEVQVRTITNCLCELQNEKNTIGGIVPLIEYPGFFPERRVPDAGQAPI